VPLSERRDTAQNLLGVGIYTRAEVARLLELSPGRVGSWVRGYRYTWGPKTQRKHGKQPAVIQTDLPIIDSAIAISFLELMELRIVQRFRAEGIPLQTVRVAWHHAAKAFATKHPFADRRVFMDRGRIFMALDEDRTDPELLIEVSSRKRPFQVIAGPIFAKSLIEVEFDEETHLVQRWWPLGRAVPIVLDPRIAFGAPVIEGTRIPTSVLSLYTVGNRVRAVAYAFGLNEAQVEAALGFESHLALAA
jgi:uncharacterized protein (DUF433 family)